MFITELEVVNSCLATMGETPLNTLEEDHSYKAAALSKLSETNRIEQKRGWWFNSEYIELVPDVSGFIYVPMDALAIKTIERVSPKYAQRGRRLFNVVNNNYIWTHNVWIDLVRLIPFLDLPFHAADAVSYGAVLRFQREFDGDGTRSQQIAQDYSRARTELSAENVRNVRPNLLATRSNLNKMGLIGGTGSTGGRIPWTPGYPR